MCLWENRTLLAERGYDLAYPGRDGVPGGKLRLQLPRPRHGDKRIPMFAARASQTLQKLAPGQDRGLILSEENIPGPMRHFYEGRFFPASRKRFLALAGAFPDRPEHVLYVVRSYAEIYASAYRKRAEDNAVTPFSELVPSFMAMDRGWPDLVAEIRDFLRPKRLTVVSYDRRGQSRDLLARLVPDLPGPELKEPDQVVNQSATDSALLALQDCYRAGDSLSRPQWRKIIDEHAQNRDSRGFAAFSAADRAVLDARYRADVDRLSALPGITFL